MKQMPQPPVIHLRSLVKDANRRTSGPIVKLTVFYTIVIKIWALQNLACIDTLAPRQ